jgi:hypothetical protein
MSADFEWHFGDEFPEEENEEEQKTTEPIWRRWLPWVLALLVVMGSAYAWWRGRQRNLAQAEAQVQQVARLELRALTEGDRELYLSLQDTFDRSWKEAQEAYVDTAGLPLPLQGLTTAISTSVQSAHVVGDRAQVEILHTATLPSGEEASFRAIRFYRYMNDGRWLHTSADPDVRGNIKTFVVGDIEISAFEEDADWIDPLTTSLVAGAYRFCRLASCRRELSMELNLAANLEEGAEPDDATLPAPFLVGAPVNDAARAAWEASLQQFLVDQLVVRETRPSPEDDYHGALFEERFRAWLKAELGISEPISPDLDLIREALDEGHLMPHWRLWHTRPDDPDRPLAAAQIDLLLAFIEKEHGAPTVARLVHSLRHADDLEEVLDSVGDEHWSTIEDRYRAYVREQTASSTDDLAAFATYDLLVACEESDEWDSARAIWGWRLDRSEATLLSTGLPEEGFSPISWAPSGARLLVQREPRNGNGYSLLHAGSSGPEEDLLLPSRAEPINPYTLGTSGWSADGNRLAYRIYPGASNSSTLESRIVDVRTGEEVTLDGDFIAWSPQGSGLIYARGSRVEMPWSDSAPGSATTFDFFVAQQDGAESSWIGEGYAAAWSPSGDQVAYVSIEPALWAYDVASGRRTTLLESDALKETLDFALARSRTYGNPPVRLAWSPDGEGVAVGAHSASDDGPEQGAILLVTDDEHHLLRRETGAIYDLAWAPHGRWLRAFVVGGEWFASVVMGRDGSLILEEENTLTTWSPDGQYLALTRFAEEGFDLQILEMESDKRQEIDVPGRCQPPVWNPQAPVTTSTMQ